MTIWGGLLILLVLALIAAIPAWPYSRGWGFSPFSLVAAACLLVVLLWALGLVELRGVEEAVNDLGQPQ
jgi:hypothetical protein